MSGTASIEAALLLPVFAILLGALFFTSRLYLARAEVRATARRCAFAYAASGCSDVLPGCEHALDVHTQDPRRNEAAPLRERASQYDVFGVLTHVPLLGEAIDGLFGSTSRASASRAVPRPWSSAAASAASSMTLICNERPRDVGAAILRVFCDRLPLLECKEDP